MVTTLHFVHDKIGEIFVTFLQPGDILESPTDHYKFTGPATIITENYYILEKRERLPVSEDVRVKVFKLEAHHPAITDLFDDLCYKQWQIKFLENHGDNRTH